MRKKESVIYGQEFLLPPTKHYCFLTYRRSRIHLLFNQPIFPLYRQSKHLLITLIVKLCACVDKLRKFECFYPGPETNSSNIVLIYS